MQHTKLSRKISSTKFAISKGLAEKESIEAFNQTKEAQKLHEQEEAQRMDHRLCEKQSQRLRKTSFAESTQRAWVKFYTSSKLGLDSQKLGAGSRDAHMQSTFRQNLLALTGQVDPVERNARAWCPIMSTWMSTRSMVAAHIFPWKSGQDAMIAIFGPEADRELFSPYNGMLLSRDAEEKFDNGALVLVPRVSDLASAGEIRAWNEAEIKQYKIRVIRPKDADMNELCHPSSDITWNELENEPVTFQGSFRPRARYLYYAYCAAMLRRAYNVETRTDALQNSLGQKFWGTVGPYIRKSMLRGFVEELGHGFDGLMDGAIPNGDDEPDETGIASANAQILRSHDQQEEQEEDIDKPVYSTVLDEESDDEDDDWEREMQERFL